ncbi:MAG TPA: portal protein, partial [Gemmatimonadales bacterium]|nr:portal protein [Gemmatimonadales bacterium]
MAAPSTLPGESSVETLSLTTEEMSAEKKAKKKADEEVLALARKRFRTCEDAYAHFRQQAQDDTRFRAGTWGDRSYQWNEGIQEKRKATDRPCLTINRAPGFVRQVTNQARSAHLRIVVNPVDDKSDVKTAEVLQGIIHNIESTSFADRAYARASEKQAEIGLGFFRLITEYADDDSFSQVIKIKMERNPLSIFIDPAAVEPDTYDAEYAFKVTDVDAETWKELTGKKDPPTPASLEGFDVEGAETGDWFPNGKIRYAEYFSRENKGPRKQIAQLSDGTVCDYPTPGEEAAYKALGLRVTKSRWVQEKQMVWRKIDAVTIHEETIWKGDMHPFVPVYGDELEVDGEKDYRGVIRDSKESARIYNVEVSALVEAVGLGQKAPIVGYRGQFGAPDSKMRKAWETANIQPHAFLEVEPVDIDGKPAPIPQRVPMETNLQGIVVAIHQSDEDYKTTAGFRDASLGERGPQESGKAILARQKQDELGSSHYLDNL